MVITGAGASVNLGPADRPVVMMGGWAASLVAELGYAASMLGLRADMRGDEFEAALGRFIAFSEALKAVAPLHRLGRFDSILAADSSRIPNGVDSDTWLRLAEQNVTAIRRVLHTNLYEQFGQRRIDDEAAHRAYSKLHHQIRSAFAPDSAVFLAHVTTNFDHAIEAAIGQAKGREVPRRVLDGFGPAYGGRLEPWAPNLLTYSRNGDDEAPVLHLHGAIGWYFTDDAAGIRRSNTEDPFNPNLTPALLLPDDKKNVARFAAPLKEVWNQFLQLRNESTHILVLGHSLHDHHLVEALRESGKPVAVVLYAPNYDPEGFDDETEELAEEFAKQLPEAAYIPGKFGGGFEGPDIEPHRLREWLLINMPR